MGRPTRAETDAPGRDVHELLEVLVTGQSFDGSEWTLPIQGLDLIEGAVRDGRAFKSSTARMTLAAAGNVRATIQNPAGSGRRVLVYKLTGLATGTAWARMRVNPTTGLPVAARPVNNAYVGHPNTAVAQMKADTDLTVALGGGTDSGLDVGIPSGSRWELKLEPMIIPAGVTLGVNVPFAGAADAVMTAYWIEEAV